MKSLNYLMDHILNIFLKKHGEKTGNSSIRRYPSKAEKTITFRIKTEYYLQFLKPETLKLFWSPKHKITKGKNGENMSHLDITEVVLVLYNLVYIFSW